MWIPLWIRDIHLVYPSGIRKFIYDLDLRRPSETIYSPGMSIETSYILPAEISLPCRCFYFSAGCRNNRANPRPTPGLTLTLVLTVTRTHGQLLRPRPYSWVGVRCSSGVYCAFVGGVYIRDSVCRHSEAQRVVVGQTSGHSVP